MAMKLHRSQNFLKPPAGKDLLRSLSSFRVDIPVITNHMNLGGKSCIGKTRHLLHYTITIFYFVRQNEGSVITDVVAQNVLDLYITKYWALKFASAAACTVLKVDQVSYSWYLGYQQNRIYNRIEIKLCLGELKRLSFVGQIFSVYMGLSIYLGELFDQYGSIVYLLYCSQTNCLFLFQIIMAKQAGGPKPKENKDWDED